MGRNYANRDVKLLFGKAGNYCAFPGCRSRLLVPGTNTDDEVLIGEIGHIIAHSDTGPRADPDFPKSERERYPNLVLLCPSHHVLVDGQDSTYTEDNLRQWKNDLEQWVDDRLTEGMSEIRFAELEVVCRALMGETDAGSSAAEAVHPAEKMAHNGMTALVSYRMKIGLMQAPQVAAYLQAMATRLDPGFPQRLRRRFVTEYERLRADGHRGDALFLEMEDFAFESAVAADASQGERFQIRAAALAVLCHLFQICEIFEAPAHAAS